MIIFEELFGFLPPFDFGELAIMAQKNSIDAHVTFMLCPLKHHCGTQVGSLTGNYHSKLILASIPVNCKKKSVLLFADMVWFCRLLFKKTCITDTIVIPTDELPPDTVDPPCLSPDKSLLDLQTEEITLLLIRIFMTLAKISNINVRITHYFGTNLFDSLKLRSVQSTRNQVTS